MDRKRAAKVSAGLTLLLTLTLRASGTSPANAPIPANGATFAGQDDTDYRRYFPLEVGNVWTFKANDGQSAQLKVIRKTKYNKNEVFEVKLEGKNFNEVKLMTVEEFGIRLWKYTVTRGNTTHETPYSEPLLEAAFPPETGKKWDVKMTDGKNIIVRTTEMMAPEEVDVPAGKFTAIPVKVTVRTGDKLTSELTTWYALDVGIVKKEIGSGEKKGMMELEKFTLKAPRDVKPPADPVKVREEVAAELKRLAEDALAKQDYELAQFLAELHLGIIGDATKDIAEEARKNLRHVPMPAARYEQLKSTAAKLHEKFSGIVRGPDKAKLSAHAMLLKHLHRHAAAIKNFNRVRESAGLAPCAWSFELSYGCTMHARYLGKSGYNSFKTLEEYHSEDPKNPYYSKEGDTAARRSDVSSFGIERSIQLWLDTLYHRIPMLHPGLKTIGTGMWDESVDTTTPSCLDLHGGLEDVPSKDPVHVVYPAADQTGVEPRFAPAGEKPKPVPGEDERKFGYPVTLTFYTHHKITKAQAKLTAGGQEVACHVSTPEKPTNPDARALSNTICLLPKQPLAAQTRYTVSITCEVDGKPFAKEWAFTTRSR